MAEKSLVNDVAEIDGVAAEVDVLLDPEVELVELELDELPHPATNRPAATTIVSARPRPRVTIGTFNFTAPPLVSAHL